MPAVPDELGRIAGRMVRIGAVDLDVLTETGVVEAVRRGWQDGRGGHIVTPNVHIAQSAAKDPEAARLVAGATIAVADGMPLVWAARMQGQALPERITGSSLVFSLSQAAAEDGRSVFLLGGDPGVPEAAADVLRERYPGLRVAGTDSPPYGFDQTVAGVTLVVELITSAAPDLVFVGLGFPKQERLIERLRQALPHAWYLGCGAGIAMAAGQYRRAPATMQRLGLEWMHRLGQEPRRLARRYLRQNIPFALRLLASASHNRLAPVHYESHHEPSALAAAPAAPGHGLPRPLAVVIVAYHSAEVIADCLTALPAALDGAGDVRVIVVDNASSDATLDIVGRVAPEAVVVRRGRNDGFATGVNAGLAAAPDCDVLVLNPDVRLAAGSVRALRAALAEPGTGIAVPTLVDTAGVAQHSLRRRPTVLRAFGEAVLGGTHAARMPALGELVVDAPSYARPGTADWAAGAAWLVSRDCVTTVGDLDERYFLYSEETEYMLRAGAAGFAVRYTPDARATHLGGEQASSPWLWALSVTNRVRLHRERVGRVAALLMWLAVLVGEGMRGVGRGRAGGARHRAALRELLRMRRWPLRPDQDSQTGQAGQTSQTSQTGQDSQTDHDGQTGRESGSAAAPPPGVVCFSAQDWWYHNQSHSDFQLMRRVARTRKVLVVNSIGMRMPLPGRSTQVTRRILRKLRSVARLVRRPLPEVPNFYVMSPLPLPFYSRPWLRRLGAGLVRVQVRTVAAVLGMRDPVIVTTLPTAWDVVRPMRRRALVFNRSDRHSEFPESDRATIEVLEQDLMRGADHVLYVSRALMAEERQFTGDRAHFLDHGVDLEHFRPRLPEDLPPDLAAIPGPRVGFFGALDDYLVDFDLIERVAAELPSVSVVLIGTANGNLERLTKYQNVHYLGFRPYQDIPAYGSSFDVALMPWLDIPWIQHSNPIKLKEYLALGLPIVSTAFAEIEHYRDRVRVGTDHAEFVELVRLTLADGGLCDPTLLRRSVLGASWDARTEKLLALVESDRSADPAAGLAEEPVDGPTAGLADGPVDGPTTGSAS